MLAEAFTTLIRDPNHWAFEAVSDILFALVGIAWHMVWQRRHDRTHHELAPRPRRGLKARRRWSVELESWQGPPASYRVRAAESPNAGARIWGVAKDNARVAARANSTRHECQP